MYEDNARRINGVLAAVDPGAMPIVALGAGVDVELRDPCTRARWSEARRPHPGREPTSP